MSAERWYTAEDRTFSVHLPPEWEAETDREEGGVDLWHPEGAGELHLLGFAFPPGELPDPAEELFAFLDEHEIELEEDDVEDVELANGGELALCEYLSEDEEAGETEFWMVGVAVIPGALVFVHYTCTAGEEQAERDVVLGALRTLRAPITA